MTVRVSKPEFNLTEKITELDKPTGLKGSELMRSDTAQDARDLVSAGRKNKIINGAMLIDQRHGGSSNPTTISYHTDRFRTQAAGMDQLNQSYQQVSDGPDGFPKSLKITTNTPESDIASTGEYLALYQKIEGQNLQDLAYGTSGAKSVTVSFYVKSSITGTFCYTVYRDESTDRAINKTYTINRENTWERKSIILEGDTVQAIGNGNTANWWNVWILGSSPGYYSAPTSVWANYSGSNWAGFHEQNGVITTSGATWQITGVQIEIGKNTTEFEHRSYEEELALCRRYYQVLVDQAGSSSQKSFGIACAFSNTSMHSVHPLIPPMRDTPTIDYTTGSNYYKAFANNTSDFYDSMSLVGNSHPHAADLMVSSGLSVTQGHAVLLRTQNAASKIAFEAEL